MICHGSISDICDRQTINTFGLTEEQFYSLPFEYQRALILGHIDMVCKKDKKKEANQNLDSNNPSIDMMIKKKILSIFKKNK